MGEKLIGRIIILTVLLIVDIVLFAVYKWPPYVLIGVILAIFIFETVLSYLSYVKRMRRSFEQLQAKMEKQK